MRRLLVLAPALLLLLLPVLAAPSASAASWRACGTTVTADGSRVLVTVSKKRACRNAKSIGRAYLRGTCRAADPSCAVRERGYRCTVRRKANASQLPATIATCKRGKRTIVMRVTRVGEPKVLQCGTVDDLQMLVVSLGKDRIDCDALRSMMQGYRNAVASSGDDCTGGRDRCRETYGGWECGTFREGGGPSMFLAPAVTECVARNRVVQLLDARPLESPRA